MTLLINATAPQILVFQYKNWRGEEHKYRVQPQAIEFGSYTQEGRTTPSENQWVLHAYMIERDDESRPVGRRTFMLSGIREVKA